MEDTLFFLILSLPILMGAILAFLLLVGAISVLHRLSTGRWLDLRNRTFGVLFGVYVVAWVVVLYAIFSSMDGFPVTH